MIHDDCRSVQKTLERAFVLADLLLNFDWNSSDIVFECVALTMNRMLFHLKHPLQPLLDYYIVVERVLRKQLNSNQNVKFGSFPFAVDKIRLVTRVQRGSTVLQFWVYRKMDFWFPATTFQKLFTNGRVSCSIIRQIILSGFRLSLTIEFGNTDCSWIFLKENFAWIHALPVCCLYDFIKLNFFQFDPILIS